MKAITLTALVLLCTATINDKVIQRAQSQTVTSPDPECKYCNDASFLFAAQDAMNDCPGQLQVLQSRIDEARTDSEVDMAWNYFCTGTCLTNIMKIDDDHTCCMGEHGPMAMNIRLACSRSSAGRYCGAELSNLRKANCTGTDPESCASKLNCQWDNAAGQCYFNGDTATINGMCTECNLKYFTNFFGGGILNPQMHALLAGTYATFCTPLNGTSCYTIAGSVGFRLADGLANTDVTNRICPKTESGRLAKMSLRSNSARVAESIRRNAIDEWTRCVGRIDNETERTDEMCTRWLTDNFNQAAAIDASAARVCVSDGSNGYCLANVKNAFVSSAALCMENTLAYGMDSCDGNCPSTSRNTLTNLGCCANTYGFNGFVNAKSNLSSLSASQLGLGYAHYNFTFENRRAPSDDWRAVPSSSAFKSYYDSAREFATSTDGFAPIRECASVAAGDVNAQCAVSSATRTYEFELALRYDVYSNNKIPELLSHAFAVDVASAIGVSRSQVTSVSARPSSLQIRVNAVNYATTIISVTIAGDSDADNQACDDVIVGLNTRKSMFFPVFGPELALNCPTAYKNGYETFFWGAFAVERAGDSPLSEKAILDNENRGKLPGGGGPASGSAAGIPQHALLIAISAAALAVVFTAMLF